ncbi:periplasmic component of amino acid ABC-type transporter/signal transduction system [Thiovulum sp. ES]|nr:periplasmic component of amino acid ABC-type transporter/signal transduction system [Thiovulum sp. ES]
MKLFLALLFLSLQLSADLKVGIKPSEPWVLFDKNSSNPKGFSIDLWNEISKRLNQKTEFIVFQNTREIIDATKRGEIDAGITSITITSKREKEIDFSHSMYELGLQVLVSSDKTSFNASDIVSEIIDNQFSLIGLGYFFLVVLFVGLLRWIIDRFFTFENEKIFPQNFLHGAYDSFWWSITMLVTFETPKTRGWARSLDLSWHIAGLLLLSITTALVTAAITTKTITGSIKSEKDLIGKFVASVENTAPIEYLEELGVNTVPVKSLEEGIELVRIGKVEALVYDGPQLIYLKNIENRKAHKKVFEVLPISFNSQSYGISFKKGNPLVEDVNQILLQLRESHGVEKSFHDSLQQKWLSQN